MKNNPTLKTKRLNLSIPTLADVPKIIEYAGHEKIAATTLKKERIIEVSFNIG